MSDKRQIEATYVAFRIHGDDVHLDVLSKDQRETIKVIVPRLSVALIAETATKFLADNYRRRK